MQPSHWISEFIVTGAPMCSTFPGLHNSSLVFSQLSPTPLSDVTQVKRSVTHVAPAVVESSSTSSSEAPISWVTQPYQLPAQPLLNDKESRINAAKQLLEGARQAPSISNLKQVFDTLDNMGLLTMAHVLVCLSRLATLRQQQELAAGVDAMHWQAEGEQVNATPRFDFFKCSPTLPGC